jgi:hypothetical protein
MDCEGLTGAGAEGGGAGAGAPGGRAGGQGQGAGRRGEHQLGPAGALGLKYWPVHCKRMYGPLGEVDGPELGLGAQEREGAGG